MATWRATTPALLELAQWEELDRAAAIKASGSPSPTPFRPIADPSAVYSHIGRAAQYGAGRRDGRTVRMVVYHVTDVDGSALGAASYDARRPDLVSATAFAGPNGELVYDVPETDRAYTTGRWNDESLALEIVGRAEWTAAQWRARPRQLEAIIRVTVDWCRRYRLDPIWLDRAAIAAGASRQGQPPRQGTLRGVTDHLEANLAARDLGASTASTSHTCVGPGLRAVLFAELLPEVARRLADQPTPPPELAYQWRPPMTALHMLDPDVRIVDTREGLGLTRPLVDNTFAIVLPDVPEQPNPTAAVLHVTIDRPTGAGHVVLYGDNVPNTSRINYAASQPFPPANTTLVNVGRDAAGRHVVRGIVRGNPADLIVDLVAVVA